MKKVLILVFNDLRHDARVLRQVNFLRTQYHLTIACFDAPDASDFQVIRINRIRPTLLQKAVTSMLLLTRRYERAYQVLYDNPHLRLQLKNHAFDLILANDIETLPLAFKIKKKEKVFFDAHEYAPRHFEDKWVWRVFFQGFNRYLCKQYLPRVDAMTTVGEGLAHEYAAHYPVKPVVLTNANYFYDLKPQPTEAHRIKLIHHGAANPSRQLNLMIDMMDYLDERFTLDLMLLTPSIANRRTRNYLLALKEYIKKNSRVRIIEPVSSKDVVPTISRYDIGVFLLPPVNFNYANTLPNKLFDFIQARLAIAIGPTPEMANLVKRYDLGVVSDDFTPRSLAAALSSLTAAQVLHFENQSHKAAADLSADKNKKILNDLVLQLLKS